MSVFEAGVVKLRMKIYRAFEDVREAKLRLGEARSSGYGDVISTAQQNYAAAHAYVNGLTTAWELVTGETWGEAAWQPGRTRR